MLNLIEKLKKVKDFRKNIGKRYPLWVLLLIIITGTMQGHVGYRALGSYARYNMKEISKTFSINTSFPSYSTIRRVIMKVDWQNLLEIFNEWAFEEYKDRTDINILSMDGKSLNSTVIYSNNKEQNFVTFVSLFSQETGLVLHIKQFENKKGSEIHQAQDTVKDCKLKNKIFTMDSLHGQTKTIKGIINTNNNYVIQVKTNQRNLYNKMEQISLNTKALSCYTELDKSHGRNVKRKVLVFKMTEYFKKDWQSIKSIIKVIRTGKRGDKPYENVAYYMSNLEEDAEIFAKIIKGHWTIENQLHWVKDVVLGEDKSLICQFQAATNLSILKTIGMNLFRSLGFLSITQAQRWLNHQTEKLNVLL